MPTVYVYNNATNEVERYDRGLNERMPYNVGNTLSVREFRGASCSDVLWTDRRTMDAWNRTREAFGRAIPVGYAFRRIWEGGHSGQSQHYAGTAFDAGQILTPAGRRELYNTALGTGAWSYVEPMNLTPTWVHFDARANPPACARGGFPLLRRGSRGNYVFVLQDALNTLGYTGGGLDGLFGAGVEDAVRRFQRDRGYWVDGIAGCSTWTQLAAETNGAGRTPTVVGGC